MWAARSHLANIFEKLLDQKTFVCLRLIGCNHLKNNLLRKCGLLAHTSPTFLKNCWIKKLLVACGLLPRNDISRENGLSHPAKGGFTPAFACQHTAIAPLPSLNLQSCFSWFSFIWIEQLLEMQLQQGKQIAKSNLLRKCGLLAHTSPTFLKNCWIKKLLFRLWLVSWATLFLQTRTLRSSDQ